MVWKLLHNSRSYLALLFDIVLKNKYDESPKLFRLMYWYWYIDWIQDWNSDLLLKKKLTAKLQRIDKVMHWETQTMIALNTEGTIKAIARTQKEFLIKTEVACWLSLHIKMIHYKRFKAKEANSLRYRNLFSY